MRVSYDSSVDALLVWIEDESPIARTVEIRDGLVDLDADGKIVGFEVLGASAVVERAAELVGSPDLLDDLTAAVSRYAKEVQAQLERAGLGGDSLPARLRSE